MREVATVVFIISSIYGIYKGLKGAKPFGVDYWLMFFAILLSTFIILTN